MLWRLYRRVKHPQPFITVVHLLLIAFALFRVLFVAAEGFVTKKPPRLILQIIGDLGLPALTSAFALTAWLMSEMTQFKAVRDNKLKKKRLLISVIGFHFIFIITIDISVGFAGTCWLLFVCELFNILWGFTVTLVFFLITMKIYRASKEIEGTFRQRAFSKPVLEMTTGSLAFMGLVRGNVVKTLPTKQDFKRVSSLGVHESYPCTSNDDESVSPYVVKTDYPPMAETVNEPWQTRVQITNNKSLEDISLRENGTTRCSSKEGITTGGHKLREITTHLENLSAIKEDLPDIALTDSVNDCHGVAPSINHNNSLSSEADTEYDKSELDVKRNSGFRVEEKPETIEENSSHHFKQIQESDICVSSKKDIQIKGNQSMSKITSLAPPQTSHSRTNDYMRNSRSESTVGSSDNSESVRLKSSSGPFIVSNSNDKTISKYEANLEINLTPQEYDGGSTSPPGRDDQRLHNNRTVAKITPEIITSNLSETHGKRKAKLNFNRTENPAHKLHVVGFTSAGLGMVSLLMGTIGIAYIYNPLLSGTRHEPNPFVWLIYLTLLR